MGGFWLDSARLSIYLLTIDLTEVHLHDIDILVYI